MMMKIANMMKRLKKNEKGFTLIELMVVIAVLGILAALIIPQFSGVTDKAKLANAKTNAQALASAASMVYAEQHNNAGFLDATATYTGATGIPVYMSNYSSVTAGATTLTILGGVVTFAKDGQQATANYY